MVSQEYFILNNQILKLSEAVKEGKGYGEGGYLHQYIYSCL